MNNSAPHPPVIALVGPPNCGKTTFFNLLSGKNVKTVNYPGSTIEYHTAKLAPKFNIEAIVLDSPGIVSLIPNSKDEEVTVNSIFLHPDFGIPDLVIVTADASQLSRHLLLTKQVIDCGFNTILAVTMLDILDKKGEQLDANKLSKELGIPVFPIDGRDGKGVNSLIEKVKEKLKEPKPDNIHKPEKYWVESDKLISTYREIEEIEKHVIKQKNQITQEKLERAKSQLKVIQPETIKHNLPDPLTVKLDKYFLHPYLGGILFFLIMSLTFSAIFWLANPVMALVDNFFASIAGLFSESFGHSFISDLISEGIISGTGAVMVFVPQIIILFLILGFMEDTGYLARGAMIADKPLNKIGLNGRSFVPMLSGFACAVPAIMAARTIPNRRERLLTIFIIPLTSCSARLPVYVLLIGFLTPQDKSWLAGMGLAIIYILSIISSLLASALINKLSKQIIKEDDSSSFILELPAYRIPKPKIILRNAYTSTISYLKNAGPIILGLSTIIWFMTTHPKVEPQNSDIISVESSESQQLENSYAAMVGKFFEPAMKPLEMDWRVGVSLISAFAAREVFVSSLAVIFKATETNDVGIQKSIISSMRKAKVAGTNEPLFTTAKIIGLIVFFIFALQCLSTIAISRHETGSWRIPLLQLLIYTGTAYLLAFITIHGLHIIGIA